MQRWRAVRMSTLWEPELIRLWRGSDLGGSRLQSELQPHWSAVCATPRGGRCVDERSSKDGAASSRWRNRCERHRLRDQERGLTGMGRTASRCCFDSMVGQCAISLARPAEAARRRDGCRDDSLPAQTARRRRPRCCWTIRPPSSTRTARGTARDRSSARSAADRHGAAANDHRLGIPDAVFHVEQGEASNGYNSRLIPGRK